MNTLNGQILGWTVGWPELLLFIIVLVVSLWKICAKAGYWPGLGLVMIVPLVNLVFMWWLAFLVEKVG